MAIVDHHYQQWYLKLDENHIQMLAQCPRRVVSKLLRIHADYASEFYIPPQVIRMMCDYINLWRK